MIYDESNSDPRVKMYIRPPDGVDQQVFDSLIQTTIDDEEHERRKRRQSRAPASTDLPKPPHEIEMRSRQYRHSFRDMKDLNNDHPTYFQEVISHAIKSTKIRKEREEAGKSRKGKGKGAKNRDEQGKGKGKEEDRRKNEAQEGGASASNAWDKGTDKGKWNKGGKGEKKGEEEGEWKSWGWNESGRGKNQW